MNKTQSINIYDYTDYRQFLHAYYKEQKARNPAFSYRYFAKKAGFNSSGLYKDIVDGRTGITRSLIMRFSLAMKFSSKQQEYFEMLVYFNEAKTVDEKKLYFERMMKYRNSKAFSASFWCGRIFFLAVLDCSPVIPLSNFSQSTGASCKSYRLSLVTGGFWF